MNSYTVDRMDEIAGYEQAGSLSGWCVGYKALDVRGHKIGKVRRMYVNRRGEPEYVEVKLGLFGTGVIGRSVMLAVAAAAVDEDEQTLTLE